MSTRRPNIVLVLADDMGWGDLGCYGATKVPTPEMDKLASHGLRATDCHSASAVCTPSRYALLTGRYAWRSPLKRHVLFGHAPAIIEASRPTLASVLREAGYATGAFGKWHLGLGWRFKDGRRWDAFDPGAPLVAEVDDGSNIDYEAGFGDGPTERGFDRFFGICGSLDMGPYCYLSQDRAVVIPSKPKEVLYPAYGRQRPGMQAEGWREQEVDSRFTEEACSWISEQVKANKSFFCYLALSAPHRPCLPPSFAKGKSSAGPRGDMVCVVDWAVGELARLLDDLRLTEDTLVIVTSDNGADNADYDGNTYGHRSNGHWRGQKGDVFEGGHRVPFLARWPGHIPQGAVTRELFSLVDLLPTLASAAGTRVPSGAAEDAYDVLEVLRGDAASPRSFLVHHSLNATFCLRSGDWKLVMGSGSGGFSDPVGKPCDVSHAEGQLYDLESDPAEAQDLWANRQDLVKDLYGELKRLAKGPASGLSYDVPVGTGKEQPRLP